MKYATILLLSFFFFSCNQQENKEEGQPATAEPVAITKEQELPEEKQDTLVVEGDAELVTLQLYGSSHEWPLQFYTYLPPNMEAEAVSSGEGDAVQFKFNEALLIFNTLPEGISRSMAQELALKSLGTRARQACDNEWEWQWGCYYATDTPAQVARVYMGEREGRYFYFLVRYPAEYGDGFTPRYNTILEQWQWEGSEGESFEGVI